MSQTNFVNVWHTCFSCLTTYEQNIIKDTWFELQEHLLVFQINLQSTYVFK